MCNDKNKRLFEVVLFIIVLSIFKVNSATNLSGEIGGVTLKASGNPYIIDDELTVSSKKTIIIDSGCVFLFKPFTGITIHGSIKIAGTTGFPVVFTSVNDQEYYTSDKLPEPFDWNGITISSKTQDVIIENTALKYSVFGIKSDKNEITINNAIFSQNGQYNFTVNGAIQDVKEGILYSYLKSNKPIIQIDSSNQMSKDTINVSERHIAQPRKLMVPIIGSVVALGAAGGSAYFYYAAYKNHKKYLDADTNFNKYINREYKSNIKGTVCIGIAATSFVVATISYLRKTKKKEDKISFYTDNMDGTISSGIKFSF